MRIGILGAGQLGRMLTLAGLPLGMRFRFFDPTPDSPAGQLAEQIVGRYDDTAELARFADGLDLVTYEFENVPAACVRYLAERLPVFPPPIALETGQDRLAEKTLFRTLSIPTPPFAAVATFGELTAAIAGIGLPAILKTRRMGYDGKGQFVLRTPADLDALLENGIFTPEETDQAMGVPLRTSRGEEGLFLLEGLIPFERELSILAARGRGGTTVCYPLFENHHRQGILRRSVFPAPELTSELQTQAEGIVTRLLEALDYVGLLAVELFEHEGQLMANEMAPRVHNSGHGTIEGAETSQFENHLRAIAGLPLGSSDQRGHAAMLNLIGTLPDSASVLAVPGSHLHLYGKAPRPGRKLGHVTLRTDTMEVLSERLKHPQICVIQGAS